MIIWKIHLLCRREYTPLQIEDQQEDEISPTNSKEIQYAKGIS